MKYFFDEDTIYYVISDLHGQGKIYDYIMNHFDKEANKAKKLGKKMVLIINGDIIDRGKDSMRMLVDVMKRVKNKNSNFEVVMLPGNHEQMMLAALQYFSIHRDHDKGPGYNENNIWFAPDNHGLETWDEYLNLPPSTQKEVFEFLKTLPLYCVVQSKKPNHNSYVICHAAPPYNALTINYVPTLGMIVNDSRFEGLKACLTYRKDEDHTDNISLPGNGLITIVGHTPVEDSRGFTVKEDGKLLMVDGGCAYMAQSPDSKWFPEMATLVTLSEVPGKTNVCLYGDEKTKYLREGVNK